MEGMWTYFLPAIRGAKKWVDEGRIGEVLHLKSSFGYPVPFDEGSRYYNPDLAGGSLLDMGVYNVAMAELFIGQRPSHLTTQIHLAPTGVDDDVLSQVVYDQSVATLHSAFRCKLNNHCYIIGEKGYIDIHDFWRAKGALLFERDMVVDSFEDHREGNGFEFQISLVNEDLIAGKLESSIVTHDASLRIQDLMSRIMQEVQ